MQRISALWQASPLKLVGALFALSLVAMMAVASGASFTSTSANAGNVVTAGNLTHGNSVSGAILTVDNLVPDESQSGTVDIENTGDVDGIFTLSMSNLEDSNLALPFSDKLDLVVEDLGDPTLGATSGPSVYTGKLGAMGDVALGTWNTTVAHRYKFTVTFPDGGTPLTPTGGDNAYKQASTEVDFNWESVSN